jgi:hypothetical protein
VTYIPLAFQPWEAPAMKLPETTGFDDLKAIAVGRLLLDNFPHIKSYWIMIGPRLAQVGLSFGADDLDGTVTEEKIAHDAAPHRSDDRARAVRPVREVVLRGTVSTSSTWCQWKRPSPGRGLPECGRRCGLDRDRLRLIRDVSRVPTSRTRRGGPLILHRVCHRDYDRA